MKNKLVSVYIPTRNRSDLLERALESVAAQSYPHIEIIVVDDHSSSAMLTRNRSICARFPNVTLLENAQSMGANFCRNKAIRMSSGRFITGLDDDDEFFPKRIERMLAAYSAEASFVCAASLIKLPTKSLIQKPPPLVTLRGACVINCVGNQIFTERERIMGIGGFDEKLPSQQDHDMWLRLLKKFGSAVGIPDVLQTVYWDHAKPQITGSSRVVKGRLMFLAKHKEDMAPADRRFYLFTTSLLSSRRLTLRRLFMVFYTYCYRVSRQLNNVFQ